MWTHGNGGGAHTHGPSSRPRTRDSTMARGCCWRWELKKGQSRGGFLAPQESRYSRVSWREFVLSSNLNPPVLTLPFSPTPALQPLQKRGRSLKRSNTHRCKTQPHVCPKPGLRLWSRPQDPLCPPPIVLSEVKPVSAGWGWQRPGAESAASPGPDPRLRPPASGLHQGPPSPFQILYLPRSVNIANLAGVGGQ